MKTEFRIEKEQLNSVIYFSKFSELENEGSSFDAAINILVENNLPADEKSIKENFCTELSLRLFLNSMAKSELEKVGGLMADDNDRDRIVSKYKTLFDDVKSVIPVFNKVFNRGALLIMKSKGCLTYDKEHNKDIAKLYATFFVDADALMKYHAMCLEMAESRKKLKEFELQHNIRNSFGLGVPFDYSDRFGGVDVIREMTIDDYFENHDSVELWVKMFGNHFKTNGIKEESK
jgi:hypothetical protein